MVIADRDHTVPTGHRLSRGWHRNKTGFGHCLALNALVHRKSEHKWVTFSQAPLQLREMLSDASLGRNQVQLRISVCERWRRTGTLLHLVRPICLWRGPERDDGFDPVSHLCTAVLSDGAFDPSLMIVDEQARRRARLRPFVSFPQSETVHKENLLAQ